MLRPPPPRMPALRSPALGSPPHLLLAALATCLLLPGCSRGPRVTLVNSSSLSLSNVVVSGSGFSVPMGTVPPGESRRTRVRPSGESSIRVAFEAGGRKVDSGEQGYVEARGGYRVWVLVGTNLAVQVMDEPR